MKLENYLDSTYLKTSEQSGLTEDQTKEAVEKLTHEAIEHHFKLVMVRPEYVAFCKTLIASNESSLLVGTVIDFPEGKSPLEQKLLQAMQAIENGADELDFVVNYTSFIEGDEITLQDEVYQCTRLCMDHGKVVKWIIEVAALTHQQIENITRSIRNIAISNFGLKKSENIFIKSSTGFYPTKNGKPNGATFEAIDIMLKNAGTLPVKAAGGVRNFEEAKRMIDMGVKRIGTSSALSLINGQSTTGTSY